MLKFINKIKWFVFAVLLGVLIEMILLHLISPYEYDYYYNKIVNNVNIQELNIEFKNEYFVNYNFLYAQNTDNLFPQNKQDAINIVRTFFNSGAKEITFYCNPNYKECIDDFHELLYGTSGIVNRMNYFNHPFNDFKEVSMSSVRDTGKITLRGTKIYSEDMIKEINKKVDEIFEEVYDKNLSDTKNLKNIYFYLLEHSNYDTEKANSIIENNYHDNYQNSVYHSNTAYGVLIEGYGICSGYADTLYLFLEKLGIKSYRIGNRVHVWNAVYLDGSWKHIDLTWGKGKTTNEKDYLRDTFFLIDSNTMLELDTTNHYFNEDIYMEFK